MSDTPAWANGIIFTHQGGGTEAESLTVDTRNGLIRFTTRGEPRISSRETPEDGWRQVATPGATAVMTMPPATAAIMAQAILRAVMMKDTAEEVFPFVVFFGTEAERDKYASKIMAENAVLVDLAGSGD